MFSHKNSTLMPISMRENSNITCSQTNQQYSSGILASSEDMYSQSQRYSNVVPAPEPNYPCEYWSQSTLPGQSSPHQDVDLKTYVGKPLLFSSRIQMHDQKARNIYSNSSIDQFYNMQKKKTDFGGKEILSNLANLLKESTEDVRNSLEAMKLSMNISADFKSDIEAMVSSVNNTEELLQKFREDISNNIKNEIEVLQSSNDLKESILKKDAEIAVKNEKIHHMQKEIDKLSLCCESAYNKENNFLEDQKDKINKLLSNCCSSSDTIKGLCNKKVEHDSMLEQLLQQNRNILQDLAAVTSWQKATNHALSSVKSSLTSVSVNVINALGTSDQQGVEVKPVKPVILPVSNIKGWSNVSPLPQNTRWFDVNGKPSPAAIVLPVRHKNQVKQKETKPSLPLPKKVVPTFDMSSDSDSGEEIHDLVDKIVANEPLKRQKNYKHNKYIADIVKSTSCVKATPIIKATPDIKCNGISSELSPYVQRSIRRFGKIRKSIRPFSPSPVTNVTKPIPNDVRATNTWNHIKKKLITLEDHWASTDITTNNSLSINRGNNLSSRSAITEKRSLENAGKFKGDYDLQKLADILHNRGIQTRSMAVA